MAYNVLYDSAEIEKSLEAIEQADADIVCLRELSSTFARAFEKRLGKKYPYRSLEPKKSGTWGVGIARVKELPTARVARARLASNANWTESRFLEDAITLFDAQGRRLLKIPSSADGFSGLLSDLRDRGTPLHEVEVSAPVFLD